MGKAPLSLLDPLSPDYDPDEWHLLSSADFSAFWLYPDWDGPVKEPFWMRPPRLPQAELEEKEATHLGRYREFRYDALSNEMVTHFYGAA